MTSAESEIERLAQTRLLLSNMAALALYADTLVVSASSNLGRFAMLMAGAERMAAAKVVSFDMYAFPTIFRPVYEAGCDGRERCHP